MYACSCPRRRQAVFNEGSSLIGQISKLEGLHSFFRPPLFPELRAAAEFGPIIIVNISQYRSDAIIIRQAGPLTVIKLPSATPEAVERLAASFSSRLEDSRALVLLREVWRVIAEPVVAELQRSHPPLQLGSRIWWSSTGAVWQLPLHAAGPYVAGQRGVFDLFTSSYTHTLRALLHSRKHRAARDKNATGKSPTMVLVTQPNTPGQRSIPNVHAEMAVVKRHVTNAAVIDGSSGTRQIVLSSMADHACVHLACHGRYHRHPLNSHFALQGGPLSLLDLIRASPARAELAVLTACHSLRPKDTVIGEPIHLAAGMVAAGFGSVVATMWPPDDAAVPAIVEGFYREMKVQDASYLDPTRAAVALRKAVSGAGPADSELPLASLLQRINFIHFGI